MKRDMDMIRLLLQEQETGELIPELQAYDEQLIVYQVALMQDAGLIEASITTDENGKPCNAAILRMT
jgi:hypothetical protein